MIGSSRKQQRSAEHGFRREQALYLTSSLRAQTHMPQACPLPLQHGAASHTTAPLHPHTTHLSMCGLYYRFSSLHLAAKPIEVALWKKHVAVVELQITRQRWVSGCVCSQGGSADCSTQGAPRTSPKPFFFLPSSTCLLIWSWMITSCTSYA